MRDEQKPSLRNRRGELGVAQRLFLRHKASRPDEHLWSTRYARRQRGLLREARDLHDLAHLRKGLHCEDDLVRRLHDDRVGEPEPEAVETLSPTPLRRLLDTHVEVARGGEDEAAAAQTAVQRDEPHDRSAGSHDDGATVRLTECSQHTDTFADSPGHATISDVRAPFDEGQTGAGVRCEIVDLVHDERDAKAAARKLARKQKHLPLRTSSPGKSSPQQPDGEGRVDSHVAARHLDRVSQSASQSCLA